MRERKSKKPSTRQQSNPQPNDHEITRRMLHCCTTVAAQVLGSSCSSPGTQSLTFCRHYCTILQIFCSAKMPSWLSNKISRQQLMSIWGPVVGESVAERDVDIDALIALNRFNGGNKITHKTISYLDDRYYL